MNKIQKFINQLTPKDRIRVLALFEQIKANNLNGLDTMKLKGVVDIYRVRSGRIRIIFQIIKGQGSEIIKIDNRNDKTYNF